jgi:hypothetical protein
VGAVVDVVVTSLAACAGLSSEPPQAAAAHARIIESALTREDVDIMIEPPLGGGAP